MNQNKMILVVGEQKDGILNHVTLELIQKSRELSKVHGHDVYALLIGSSTKKIAEEVARYDIDKVYYVENEAFQYYNTDAYTTVISEFFDKFKPDVVFIGATPQGRDLAPRLAARNRTGLTADCTELEFDEDGLLLMTRPAFGGNLMATITCENHRPQMATVRPGVFSKGEKKEGPFTNPEMFISTADLTKVRGKILEQVKQKKETANISEAKVLIAGGRGMGGKAGFDMLKKLAELLDGTVAASRPVIDQGWIDKSHQVGQTGKTVRPRLYIACGISGALQHIAGMQESDFIIAINKNEDAPIMKIADLAIVGDVHKIIPEMIKRLEADS
ncbi:MAG TPA: electron transfer flavoprotein subunit alpha/FixB family protein [Thermotogota bacterium]|nr:electron transfer flavoprotein subunit alpha/FixB family protein [Thermotogota bacterium]HPJ87583.1 electron transfer flavoprotein subunit alpha/FixB family protein [Thermotogota bacterium]HPR94788.1 electron transfer flavoprotein subunit alpha/FixB family protein [Thermotogota bacterium]